MASPKEKKRYRSPHRLGIGGEDVLPPGKGGHQHNEGALRQVEVGHQAVHHLEFVAGVDIDVRPAGPGLHMAVVRGPGLQCPAGGGAHADAPAPTGPGLVDEVRRLLWDGAVLAVHGVVLDGVLLHRAEGAEAHMEGHIADPHAFSLDDVQQLRREVEPRRGGGGAAQDLGVHGLIPLLVLELLLDIGGQGHPAQVLQHLQEDALVVEADQAAALLQLLYDLGGELSIAEGELRALAELPAGAHQALPDIFAPVIEQQHLADAATGEPLAHPGGPAAPGSC